MALGLEKLQDVSFKAGQNFKVQTRTLRPEGDDITFPLPAPRPEQLPASF